MGELNNLEKLTELGSTCTPNLLNKGLAVQPGGFPLPGSVMTTIVMERLPGHELPISERDQVRLAFAKTIREFYSFRFNHTDPARRNLIWDSKNQKCYIIDLEDAYEIEDESKKKSFVPERDYFAWEIAGPETVASMGGIDPMVPSDRMYAPDPGDEALEKMAIDARGKPLKPEFHPATPHPKK